MAGNRIGDIGYAVQSYCEDAGFSVVREFVGQMCIRDRVKQIDKNEARLRRHRRVRNKISGTAARPRLDVYRSAKHIYAQIIDDEQGVTLVSASTMDKEFNRCV